MPQWYALFCLRDQFDEQGKLDYRAGEVKSFGTVISPKADRDAKGIEAIPIGDYGEAGPDFNRERFDTVLKRMVPYTPPKDEADALLDKPTWSSGDTEQALRAILKRLKG